MTEKPMVFWSLKRLSREYNMDPRVISRLLKAIGAQRWSGGGGTTRTVYYWEEGMA